MGIGLGLVVLAWKMVGSVMKCHDWDEWVILDDGTGEGLCSVQEVRMAPRGLDSPHSPHFFHLWNFPMSG